MNEIPLPVAFAGSLAASPSPAPAASRSVFLPKEHGSWALALEPVVLGLVLAPSWAGAALAVAVFAGFLARRPFKASFAATNSPRRIEARETVCMLTALAVAGGFEALVLAAEPAAFWPLALALPAAAAFARDDARGKGRTLAAEISGSVAFALVPAAFATLAGRPVAAALILAGLALVRGVPTVLTLRAFLRRRKGERAAARLPLLAAGAGFAVIVALVVRGPLGWPAAVAAGGLLLRTGWLLSPWRPAWSARRAGIFELLLGLAYLGVLAAARPEFSTP